MSTDKTEPNPPPVARRRLLLGTGATALVAVGALRDTEIAEAKTGRPRRDKIFGLSGRSTAAAQRSNPLSGYTYRSASFMDFHPIEEDNWRRSGNDGTFATGLIMFAAIDVPAGAVPRDVEWYFTKTASGSVEVAAGIWMPGLFDFNYFLIENYGSSVVGQSTRRTPVPAGQQYVYPAGARMIFAFIGNGNPAPEIVGARAGFTGGGAVTMRDVPYRAYDSRTQAAGILGSGQTRTVGIPTSVVPVGTSAVIINLTALGASNNGYLRAYAAHAAAPTTSSINFAGSGAAIANGLLVGVSSNGLLKVYASTTAHFIVDVLGTVS